MPRLMEDGWSVVVRDVAGFAEATLAYHEYYQSAAFNCVVFEDRMTLICFGNSTEWERDYPWLAFRRDEIVQRVVESVLKPGWVAELSEVSGCTFAHVRKQVPLV